MSLCSVRVFFFFFVFVLKSLLCICVQVISFLRKKIFRKVSASLTWGSNPGPLDSESNALSTAPVRLCCERVRKLVKCFVMRPCRDSTAKRNEQCARAVAPFLPDELFGSTRTVKIRHLQMLTSMNRHICLPFRIKALRLLNNKYTLHNALEKSEVILQAFAVLF